MDMAGNETNVNYHAPIEMVTIGNSMVESSSCSSTPMLDSVCPSIWQSSGYCNMNNSNFSMELREGTFLPTVPPRMLPHSLPHFPSDSAFIERATRFSCFNGGSFSEMVNPFSIIDPLNHHAHKMNTTNASKEALLHGDHGLEDGSPIKNEKKIECFMRFRDEAKNGVDESGNQCGGAEFSGRGVQQELDCADGESSGKGLGLKKRKRTEQKTEPNENNEAPQPSVETAKDNAETREKGDQNQSCKPEEPQGSDPPKEEYIHVRARRGQATNSHSLAERIRREKISERMKFLQDLVPGCNKVTGKAVMLDEIINYVQSLQRQVEFLSMKLATVNPRVDFNMEGFLANDILQHRAGLSYSLPFPHDMALSFPPLQPTQPGLVQAVIPGMASEALLKPISIQSTVINEGFREPNSQAPSVWDDELHNVVHNGINMSSLNIPDLSVSVPGHNKAEP